MIKLRADRRDKPIYINGNPLTGTFKRFHEGDYHATEPEIKVIYGDAVTDAKDLMEIEQFTIDNIDKETLEDYRISFRLNKGKDHKYTKLSDEEIYKYAKKYLEENLHIGRSRIIYINLNWLKI